jgi:trimeric autotransporter adhesin
MSTNLLRITLFVIACSYAIAINTLRAQSVQTGKSYINISKPTGGTIQNGDQLEIRAVIAVGGGSIYFARYNDTLPAGVTYIANSIRFTTNEGMNYGTPLRPTGLLTDAGGDDEARFNAGVLRVNVGSLSRTGGQTAAYNAVVAPNAIDVLPAASGCRIYNTGRPSFYGSACIIMITYRVIVNTTAGNTIAIPGGAFRFKTANTFSEATLPSIVRPLNRMTIMVTDPLPVCNAVGTNSITGNGGNFGSGSTQNLSPAPAPGTVVPGYQWRAFASPTTGPNDSMFTVANNTSPTASVNNNLAYPNSNRQFNVWDIIGDHTGAADPLLGNPATTPGQPGGYMAVVNAAYGINNAVQQTVTGLCPDTYYEFSAWFRNICRRCSSDTSGRGSGSAGFKSYLSPTIPNTNDSAGVLPNLTFMVDGMDYYTTGNLDYTAQWIKKGFLFRTGPAQTSVNIVIRNNAPGGGGNDWVMDDIAFATCLPALTMRPTNTPTYCVNNQVDISVAVATFFDNYSYYTWERSTDGGTSWIAAPELPGQQTFSFTNYSGEYRDTAFLPSFISSPAYDGYKYRIRVATTSDNLTSGSCAVYNAVDIITIDVNSSCDVLNMQLKNEQVHHQQQKALLQWNAFAEKGNFSFTVERSTDGRNFTAIGKVDGIAGSWQVYRFVDLAPAAGKNYYRIRMIPAAGAEKISATLLLMEKGQEEFVISSLVNPFAAQLRFDVQSPFKETVIIQLIDVTGKVLYSKHELVSSGINRMQLNNLPNMKSGIYILRLHTSLGVITKQVKKAQ